MTWYDTWCDMTFVNFNGLEFQVRIPGTHSKLLPSINGLEFWVQTRATHSRLTIIHFQSRPKPKKKQDKWGNLLLWGQGGSSSRLQQLIVAPHGLQSHETSIYLSLLFFYSIMFIFLLLSTFFAPMPSIFFFLSLLSHPLFILLSLSLHLFLLLHVSASSLLSPLLLMTRCPIQHKDFLLELL